MKLHKLETKQVIKTSLDNCWDFFSNPKNLKEITPNYMGFEMIENIEENMYAGQLIQYIVKPILGIKMRWVSEISQVKNKEYFIDEQRFGPYKIWHHQHFFTKTKNGVEMRDVIHYGLPLGVLGNMAHELFVRKQLNAIFSYRFQKINQLFNEKN